MSKKTLRVVEQELGLHHKDLGVVKLKVGFCDGCLGSNQKVPRW